MEYLFVYGTLMRKYSDNPFRTVLATNTSYVAKAFTYGKLFLVDYYPALIHNLPSENHKVYGEIVSFRSDSGILKTLDEYEEYYPSDTANSMYIRKLVSCFCLEDNKEIHCNTYFYNKQVENLKLLSNGRFFLS